ncbi:MAG: 16S rRNA (cytidine(1402)-2'-O)-methyltransferase, partial [Robiginitomaculum sp.]|nr:16S rRNA (cytidine(1402)-2'-O)-methyltransferase [Robiginitomaculum sp.]
LRGSLTEMCAALADKKLRGEIVVLIAPPKETIKWDDAQIIDALKIRIPDIGVKRASEEIAGLSGQKKRDVYGMAISLKNEI